MNLLNKTNIVIVVCLLVAAGAGTYFYQQSVEQKEETSKSALFKVQKTLEAESSSLTEAEKAVGAKFDVEAKFPKAIAEMNQLLANKSINERVLFDAALKLGTLYFEYGTGSALEKAMTAFQQADKFAKSKLQKASALYLLGSVQEQSNLVKESADSFQKALAQEHEGLKEELLLSLVRVNVKKSDLAQAKTFADQLNKLAPGSKAAQEAQKLLGSKT